MFALSGKLPLSMVGLPHILLAFLAHMLLRSPTGAAIYGTEVEVTGAHILLFLSPPITAMVTGSRYISHACCASFLATRSISFGSAPLDLNAPTTEPSGRCSTNMSASCSNQYPAGKLKDS